MLGPPLGSTKTDATLRLETLVDVTADGGCLGTVTFFRTAYVDNSVVIQATNGGSIGSVQMNVAVGAQSLAPSLTLARTAKIMVSNGGIIGSVDVYSLRTIAGAFSVVSSGASGTVGETNLYGDAAVGGVNLIAIKVKTDGDAAGTVGLVRANEVSRLKSGVVVEGNSNLISGVVVVAANTEEKSKILSDFRWNSQLTCDEANGKCACPVSWSSPSWPSGSSNPNNKVTLQLVGFDGMLAAMASLTVNGVSTCTIDDCPDVGNTTQFRDSSGLDICRDATLPCDSNSYEERGLSATKDRICTPISPPCNISTAESCESTACFESDPPSATNDRTCSPMTPPCAHDFFELVAPTSSSDRECNALSAECGSNEFEAQQPSYVQDRECLPISIGCPDAHYESSGATRVTDRVCTPVSDPCVLGTTYESVPPAWNTDRRCTPVSKPCNAQDETLYEAAPPQLDADRVCNAITVCPTGSTYEESAPTPTSDRVCPDLNVCAGDEFEQTPATATTNRQCTSITPCIQGTYEHNAATTTSDKECVVWKLCSDGFYEIAPPPSQNTDRVCGPCFDGDGASAELDAAAQESGECDGFLDESSSLLPPEKKSGAAAAAGATVAILVLVGLGAFVYIRKHHASETEEYFKPSARVSCVSCIRAMWRSRVLIACFSPGRNSYLTLPGVFFIIFPPFKIESCNPTNPSFTPNAFPFLL